MTLTDKQKLWMAIRKYKANDKKIEEVLHFIDDFMKSHGIEKYKQSDMKNLLKEIVKTLEVDEDDGWDGMIKFDVGERIDNKGNKY